MKTLIAAAVLALGAGVVAASAQDVVIVPEQETVIREYVKSRPAASIQLPGIELNLGATVPEEVELYAIEEGDIDYRYVVVDDRTVLVDPGTRKVVRILD